MWNLIKNLLKSPYILVYALTSLLFLLGSGFRIVRQPLRITFKEALEMIFEEYPEVEDQGETQRYFSEQVSGTWYISIAYLDNEQRIEGGDCFRVTKDDVVYVDSIKISSSRPTRINPITCEAK